LHVTCLLFSGFFVQACGAREREHLASENFSDQNSTFKVYNRIETGISWTDLQLVPDSDGGVIMAKSESGFVLTRADANGNTLWKKNLPSLFGFPEWGRKNALFRSSDNATIVVGNRAQGRPGEYLTKGWIAKINDDGSILWQKPLGLPAQAREHYVVSAAQVGNKYVIATGASYGGYQVNEKLLLLNETGEIEDAVSIRDNGYGVNIIGLNGTEFLMTRGTAILRIALENNQFMVKAAAKSSVNGLGVQNRLIYSSVDGSLTFVVTRRMAENEFDKIAIVRLNSDLSLAWSKVYPKQVYRHGRKEADEFRGFYEEDGNIVILAHVLNDELSYEHVLRSPYSPAFYHDERLTISPAGELVKVERNENASLVQRQIFIEDTVPAGSEQKWITGFINLSAQPTGTEPDFYNVFLAKANGSKEVEINGAPCSVPDNYKPWSQVKCDSALVNVEDSLSRMDAPTFTRVAPEVSQEVFVLNDVVGGAGTETTPAQCPWQPAAPSEKELFCPESRTVAAEVIESWESFFDPYASWQPILGTCRSE